MEKRQRVRFLLVLLIFVGALYRYWPIDFPLGPCGGGYESLELGCSLAKTGTFADPFRVPSGPSAHLAPLFPWLVSGLIRWLGDGPAAMNALQWLGTVVVAFQLSLWPWVTERLGMGFAAGVIGAAGWLVAGFVLLPFWEAAYIAPLILILVVCMHRILSEKVSTAFVLLTGVLWGVVFLFSPVPLVVFLALCLWIVCFKRMPRVQKLALVLIPFLVISPWLARNYQVFHHFILIRDNLGMELSNSNRSCATFSFRNNAVAKCNVHPMELVSEDLKIRKVGEYEYNQGRMREALGWIKSNPRRFAELTKQRFLAFWLHGPGNEFFGSWQMAVSSVIIWAAVPLSVGGLWLLWKSDRNTAGLCLAWLLLFPPVYYIVAFVPRYRYPILWASLMPASYFLTEVVGAVRRRWKSE